MVSSLQVIVSSKRLCLDHVLQLWTWDTKHFLNFFHSTTLSLCLILWSHSNQWPIDFINWFESCSLLWPILDHLYFNIPVLYILDHSLIYTLLFFSYIGPQLILVWTSMSSQTLLLCCCFVLICHYIFVIKPLKVRIMNRYNLWLCMPLNYELLWLGVVLCCWCLGINN